jgi:hypothetical protein
MGTNKSTHTHTYTLSRPEQPASTHSWEAHVYVHIVTQLECSVKRKKWRGVSWTATTRLWCDSASIFTIFNQHSYAEEGMSRTQKSCTANFSLSLALCCVCMCCVRVCEWGKELVREAVCATKTRRRPPPPTPPQLFSSKNAPNCGNALCVVRRNCSALHTNANNVYFAFAVFRHAARKENLRCGQKVWSAHTYTLMRESAQLQLLVSALAFYREKSAACLATYLSRGREKIDLPAASKETDTCLILMAQALQTTLCEVYMEREIRFVGKSLLRWNKVQK